MGSLMAPNPHDDLSGKTLDHAVLYALTDSLGLCLPGAVSGFSFFTDSIENGYFPNQRASAHFTNLLPGSKDGSDGTGVAAAGASGAGF